MRFRTTTKTSEIKREGSISRKKRNGCVTSLKSPASKIFFLQRSVGNQAVKKLIKSGYCQNSLRIGRLGDRYEQEADRVAEQVMRMPESCSECKVGLNEEETLQAKSLSDQITCLHQNELNRAVEENTNSTSTSFQRQIRAMKGGGQPLPKSTRNFFEPRFGYDFSNVRIHTNNQAAKTAKALNAKAFTTKNNIAFASGMYAPETTQGKKLIAHELTHTIQQTKKSKAKQNIIHQQNCVPAIHFSNYSKPKKIGIEPVTNQDNVPKVQCKESPKFASNLLGSPWLSLPKASKAILIDKMIDLSLIMVDKFPGKSFFGKLWIFLKEGLVGFYKKLRSEKVDTKIFVMDKIVKIMTGPSIDFLKGYFVGVLKGFFVDGLLGIFIALWDLIKCLPNLWYFFTKVDEIIGGFPDAKKEIVRNFINLGQTISNNIDSAIKEFKKFITDPSQAKALISKIVQKGKSYARKAGGRIAKSLVKTFLKSDVEKKLGESTGKIIGMGLFELIFAVLTSGAGSALTYIKIVTKFLATLRVFKFLSMSVLKIFRILKTSFGILLNIVKRLAKFVKGKTLSRVIEKLKKLLFSNKKLMTEICEKCREKSPIVCNFPPRKPARLAQPSYLAKIIERLCDKFPKLRDSQLRVVRRGTGRGMFEERMRTGGGHWSFKAKLRDGRQIQLDDISSGGITELKVRSPTSRHLQREIEGGFSARKLEIQMEKQSQFISENGLPHGVWQTNNPKMYEIFAEIKTRYRISNIQIELIE